MSRDRERERERKETKRKRHRERQNVDVMPITPSGRCWIRRGDSEGGSRRWWRSGG